MAPRPSAITGYMVMDLVRENVKTRCARKRPHHRVTRRHLSSRSCPSSAATFLGQPGQVGQKRGCQQRGGQQPGGQHHAQDRAGPTNTRRTDRHCWQRTRRRPGLPRLQRTCRRRLRLSPRNRGTAPLFAAKRRRGAALLFPAALSPTPVSTRPKGLPVVGGRRRGPVRLPWPNRERSRRRRAGSRSRQ